MFINLIGVALLMHITYAQDATYSIQEQNDLLEKDALLKKLQTQLPPLWTIEISKEFLTLKREGEIWVLNENKINARCEIETEEERIQQIQKYGRKTSAQLRFKRTLKWTPEQMQQAKDKNTSIYKAVQKLPEKYQITHLFHKNLSRKGEEVFIGNTEEDQKRIKEYIKEKEALENTIIRLPDYSTSQFSLFLESAEGMENAFHTVHPPEASAEMYKIQNMMDELLR